jgi:quercetin dioxygenase-like cupin family protein
VLQTPVIEKEAPARLRATMVNFEPGARTAWHTHPLGQTLYVVSGAGRVQSWGEPVLEIRAGDVISFAPGEKHWHGAGPSTGMVHMAMQEALDGVQADWLDKVSDEQYAGK